MKKNKKIEKQKKILLIILIILIIILAIVIYFKFFKQTNKKINSNETTDTIEKYDYHLKEQDSQLTQELFKELKTLLDQEDFDEEEYAKLISKLFIIDFYTLNNKLSNTDIGGTQYIYPDIKDNFILKAKDTIYKYVKNNIYGERTQELPTVIDVEIEDIKFQEYTSQNYQDQSSYQVKTKISYDKDLDYPNDIILTLIHQDNKLYIIEVN